MVHPVVAELLVFLVPDFSPSTPEGFFRLNGYPGEIRHFLKQAKVTSDASVQKCLLDVLGSTMNRTQRVQLGLKAERCGRPYVSTRDMIRCRKHRRMIRRWYKKSEKGQLQQLDALYRLVRVNPGVFLSMLSKNP